jgi:hypothetical protein
LAKETKEFRGKTEGDILETQLTAWLQQMAGQIRDVKVGPIERLPLNMGPTGPGTLEAENAFSMLVEYEPIGLIDDDEPKPKYRKLKTSSAGSRTASTAQKKPKRRGLRPDRRVGANPIKRKKRRTKRGRRS